jgi:hypothetical protein
MPVTLGKSSATLSGVVSVDDAEPLAQWLRDTARPRVRLADCTHLHTAALQALMVAGPAVTSAPTDPFLARWIAPLLAPVPVSAAAPGALR